MIERSARITGLTVILASLAAMCMPAPAQAKPLPLLGAVDDAELAEVVLVRDGSPTATIVTASNPTSAVRLAVAELNMHLEAMSGVRLPVATDEQAPFEGPMVLVGESATTRSRGWRNDDFHRQQFLVRTAPGVLLLMGRDHDVRAPLDYEGRGVWEGFDWLSKYEALGSLYAVYEFLERCCGVRWYLPGDAWTVVPERRTLAFADLHRRRRPWARYRQLHRGSPMPRSLYFWDFSDRQAMQALLDDPELRLSNRDCSLYWLRQRVGGEFFNANHSFNAWPDRFLDSHPEYFAVGPEGQPMPPQINLASDAVVRQIVEDIGSWMRGRRADAQGRPVYFEWIANGIFPVMPSDTTRWSHDERSRELLLDEPSRQIGNGFCNDRASRYVFEFVNSVARELREMAPQATVSCCAYREYFFAPRGMLFEPNVSIMVSKPQVKNRTEAYDEAYHRALREWREAVERLYVWEYYNMPQWGRRDVFPGIVPHRIAEDMRFLRELGIEGQFIEINTAWNTPLALWLNNPALQHMNYYFALKLLDDPALEIEDLLDDYYHRFYGPAADPMATFFERIEDTYMDPGLARRSFSDEAYAFDGESWVSGLTARDSWTIYCPPERLSHFIEPIAEAKRLATEEPYRSRVTLIDEAVLQFIVTSCRRYHRRQEAIQHLLGEGVVLPLTEGWRYHADPANAGIGSGWFRRSFPADDWRPIQMPAEGGWYQWIDEARDVVWYRNQVEVTPDMLRDHVYLYVPAADRNCLVWVNGELVLEHTAEAAGVVPERLWDTPFAVDVREHLDAAEPNVVVMRVDHPRIMGRVHFPVYLVATDAETSIEVLGEVAERIRERVEDHNG